VAQLLSLGGKTMHTLAKVSRAFAVLFIFPTAYVLTFPWRHPVINNQPLQISMCVLVAFVFGLFGVGLYMIYRRTRTSERSTGENVLLWLYVTVTGFIGSIASLWILSWIFFPLK
jgi:hypothetical protein